MHSADTSLLLSTIPSSTVQTINETNRLVDRVRECADLPVVIHSHSQAQVLVPVEWSDSSEANRPDGKSTKGPGGRAGASEDPKGRRGGREPHILEVREDRS
eukprot:3515334-Pyramimonas_sp.AAC.1